MRKTFVLLVAFIALTGCRGASRGLRKGATEAVAYFATEEILKSTFDSKKEKEQSPPKEDLSNSNYLQSSSYSLYPHNSTHSSISTYLSQEANDLNSNLPRMVNRELMLASVIPLDDALVYQYVLVNTPSRNVNSRQFVLSTKHKLTNSTCSEPSVRTFLLDYGVSIHHSYRGNDDIHIGEVVISPADCRHF